LAKDSYVNAVGM